MKSLTLVRTQKFFQTYPYILIFHHLNFSGTQWTEVRNHASFSGEIFVVKNRLVHQIVRSETTAKLFQGACFVVGFHESNDLKKIFLKFTQSSKIYLVGGIFMENPVTHLDIVHYMGLEKTSSFENLISTTTSSCSAFLPVLSNSSYLDVMVCASRNLVECLERLASSGMKSPSVHLQR